MNPQTADRNQRMAEARRQGATFREIAAQFGVTPQRAHQIVRATDPELEGAQNWRRTSAKRVHAHRRWEVISLKQQHPDMTLANIAERTKSSQRFVRETLIEHGLITPQQTWTRERVVQAMRHWHRRHGDWPRSHEWRCSGESWPCTATVVSRYGWSSCLREARGD